MMRNNKAPRETRTFLLQKSASMEGIPIARSISLPKKQHPSVEFPTSPNLIMGEEIRHPSHPHHLVQLNLSELFTCAGCKEYGAGCRFSCQQCDFQLHEFCALAPSALKCHPFHCHHQLSFYSKPVKGGILKSKCDVCWKPTKGYNFGCSACSFQMHPCCAKLSTDISIPAHPHTLKLLPVNPLSNGDPGFVCGECRRRRSGRVYHCPSCDHYHLHAVCAKNMLNGLHDNGINKGIEKPSMISVAAKFASQVMIEFIGGLIQGLGEGVGESLMQKGNCNKTTRNSIAEK